MARAESNIFLHRVRGSLGETVTRQLPDGSNPVSKTPGSSSRKFSEGQAAHWRRFRQAAAYARRAQRQPIYAELASRMGKTAYTIALSDWFRPPVIRALERRGAAVFVEAADEVMVTRVQVTVFDARGKAVEKGEGARREGDWWEYVPRARGKTILVEAWDLAGNRVAETL
jgi:hypothetical protein